MIHVPFVPPCFECEVDDQAGNRLVELHAASDEPTLRAALEVRVKNGGIRKVIAVQAYDFEQRWRVRARQATRRAIEARGKPATEQPVAAIPSSTNQASSQSADGKSGGKRTGSKKAAKAFEFESRIWAELKDHLIRLFHHKCAYCEAYFDHVDFGDVEHYRPKKKVDGEPAHPGYYWLAYDERNLLPSCKLCNQARGKMNQFPVAGVRAMQPGDDLDAEQPLLLNPYRDDPSKHLHFIPRIGTVAPRSQGGTPSPLGDASWKAYNLNRERLIEFRRREQQNIRQSVSVALVREDSTALTQTLQNCIAGRQQFASASLAEIEQYFAQFGLPVPLPEARQATPALPTARDGTPAHSADA